MFDTLRTSFSSYTPAHCHLDSHQRTPLPGSHMWQDCGHRSARSQPVPRQLLVGLDPALSPVTGLHHWAYQ